MNQQQRLAHTIDMAATQEAVTMSQAAKHNDCQP
jgi:hypothetical protein